MLYTIDDIFLTLVVNREKSFLRLITIFAKYRIINIIEVNGYSQKDVII